MKKWLFSLSIVHPIKAYFALWIAMILSLKNTISRKPYAWRFMVLILLLILSSGPFRGCLVIKLSPEAREFIVEELDNMEMI